MFKWLLFLEKGFYKKDIVLKCIAMALQSGKLIFFDSDGKGRITNQFIYDWMRIIFKP
ncbi:hypothetical protein ADIARSV_0841 [Arcticibacter svalbardensis MN12-7]|uniref:Uncharacterized protein n=1 Tax=Arcticibacter svalbardensis MN12-7 TaxID=1150600 RepID=R9GW19_9SPHI|nr:hypothetical protein ADIARSV_0841 [Arcticibacter svalbardensis MN12-7]